MRVFFTFAAAVGAFSTVYRLTHDWVTAWGCAGVLVCSLIAIIEAIGKPRQ